MYTSGLSYLLKFQQDLTNNATKWELKIKQYLDQLKIQYEFQKIITTSTKSYIVDFYLPKYKVIIEVDGKFHYTVKNSIKDNVRTKHILNTKVATKIGRLKNSRVNKLTLTTFEKWLKRLIS